MKLQNLVEALDAQILSGDIIGAFDKFAADNCVTKSSDEHITQNKAQKIEILNWFFQNVAATNRIERFACKVNDTVTESQFVFDFVNNQGQPMVYNEVIRRTWKDGKVVEEQYLMGQTLDVPAKTAAKKPSKNVAAKTSKPAAKASKTTTAKKATKATKKAEPKADQKPASTSAAKPATAKSKAGRK